MAATVPTQQGSSTFASGISLAGKLRVLLVVDTRDEGQNIRDSLREHCFVEIQTDAERAYSFYRPKFYDLIIVDYRTSSMDSFQFYLNIRKVDQTTKVCLITTDDTKAPEKTVTMLRKPFDKATLITTISKLLES